MIEDDGKPMMMMKVMMMMVMMMVMIMVGNFWSPLRVLMTVSLKTFWRAEMF
jgi:hypothetical protein